MNITIYLDPGVGKHRKIYLLSFYFTGEDCTNDFKDKGNKDKSP